MLSARGMRMTDGETLRARLRDARLMLIFTPELCAPRDPMQVLAELAQLVDIVQVRIKPPARSDGTQDPSPEPRPGAPSPPAEARASHDWCLRILESFATLEAPPLVLVDDRVDVALSLLESGCAGVHLGQHDYPLDLARKQLGPDALIGLSTHDVGQVARALETDADYVGFGPIFPTSTKGYARGLGPETAWVADAGSGLPLFPIGGIDLANAHTLVEVGRAAVSSALLASPDPARAARELRELLTET